ncbi:HK97 family phage major capsid protein [Rhodoglobus vestalii]|uniref:HK97 family phage major capsid protein n=1 Tax=Rhodoglobus vestalii TaxID=193384 RepID=A0A8H2K7L8_9MICO|nr:phage major capsid protein [Rhodoglobus vestalii]TQO20328.1 HK97 family phage major capsid protein [Rhodoglobus vestalii]
MASSTTSPFNKSYLPSDFGDLLIATASQMSVALQVATVVITANNEFRIPTITAEAGAGWYAENADISLSDATAGEEVVRPRKIAGLSKLSSELVDDSSPEATRVVGESVARSIATGIDSAFFGTADGTGVPPKGIGAFADGAITLVTTESGTTTWADSDPFTSAIFKVEALGGNLTSFIANPVDAELLAKLKKETGSNEPLLSPDATSPTTRRLAGAPLFTSSSVAVGTVIGIDKSRTFVVLRKDVGVEVDRSVFFDSDSVAVRGIARVAFGYPHAKSLARVKLSAT